MATLRDRSEAFPQIAFRIVNGETEPYLPGTGLAVWEIAWIAGLYKRDIEATVCHLGQPREAIEEALAYTDANEAEVNAAIKRHVDRPLEELQELLPEMRILHFDAGESGKKPT